MSNEDQHTSQDLETLYHRHVDMVYRVCFILLKNHSDTEDAVQAVFIKVVENKVQFKSPEHEKAWFIVTAKNYCKNQLSHWWKKTIAFDANQHDSVYDGEKNEILDMVLKLPEKFKMPIYLYYYEGYSTDEVAELLEINSSTLRSRLKKGRELLKDLLGGEPLE